MRKLVTKDGWEFNSQSFVKIGDEYVDIDELSDEQRDSIALKLNINGLNAAYAGKAHFYSEGLHPFDAVSPNL